MKYYHIFLFAWLAPAPAHAGPEAGFALKAGLNAATSAGDAAANRYGFTGGLAGSLQWPLVDDFSLAGQMELLYTPRGPSVVFEGEYLGKFRQHYFDVVIAARPETRLGPTSVYLLLGGGLSLLLSADKETALGFKEDITGDLRRIDVTLLAGAGVALRVPSGARGPLRFGTIFLEARHDHGLIPAGPTGGLEGRTSSLMLGLSLTMSSRAAASRSPPSPPGEITSSSPATAADRTGVLP